MRVILPKYQRRYIQRINLDLLRRGEIEVFDPLHLRHVKGVIYKGRKGRRSVRRWREMMRQVSKEARRQKWGKVDR